MISIFLLGICFYFIIMAVIGYLASRRVKTLDEYLIAGRRLPLFLAVPTVVATWFGAGSSMGVSGAVYSQGFYGVVADPFGCSLALLISGLVFAAPFRRLKLLTISDLLGKAYGERFEKASSILVLPFYIGTLASQMLAMGYVFQLVTQAPLSAGILIAAVIVVTYTMSGGMWAVTLTDFIQFGMLGLGLCTLVPVVLGQLHDTPSVVSTFLQEFKSVFPDTNHASFSWLSYSGRVLMTGLGAIMGQDLLQRFLASKNESVARLSGIIGAMLYMLLGCIPLFIGIAGRDIFPHLEVPEHLIPLLAKEYLTPFAFMIFSCGLFSATMSTADSYLLAGTTLITHNVILKIWPMNEEKRKLRLVRLVNLVIALIAIALAFTGQSIFNLMVHSGTILFVAIFVPATVALFYAHYANELSAWASVICGMSSWLSYLYFCSDLSEDHLFASASFGALISLMIYVAVTIFLQLYKQLKAKRELLYANTGLSISSTERDS